MDITRIIKEVIRKQQAYSIEEQPCRIKLDANENPYTLTPSQQNRIFEHLKTISLNRYPDPGATDLKEQFAQYFGIDEDMLMLGNGSDELIQLLLTAFDSSSSGGVVIPVPTFAMYKISAVNTGHTVIEVPLNDQFDLDLENILDTMSQNKPHLIFLSYPNNPTGNLFDSGKIEKILMQTDGLVVVDEAYVDFSGKTFLPDFNRWDNLVILRTLSKVGFAAIRLGILIGKPSLVHELNKVRLPYNLNALSQAVGLFFHEYADELQKKIDRIILSRQHLFNELTDLEGIYPYHSDSNFILFSCAHDKNRVYSELLKRGIGIKNFTSPDSLRDCFRVTVGSDEENREFLEALRKILHQ
ncbi:MAG: histidinol-phosphate transaminase [Deltaproteobacteria bacterium]|nr:histidinol-phosphate transaminase [Deltaproteobacteria bacterium]